MPAALLVIATVLVRWRVVDIDVPALRRDALFATSWASNGGTISRGGNYLGAIRRTVAPHPLLVARSGRLAPTECRSACRPSMTTASTR